LKKSNSVLVTLAGGCFDFLGLPGEGFAGEPAAEDVFDAGRSLLFLFRSVADGSLGLVVATVSGTVVAVVVNSGVCVVVSIAKTEEGRVEEEDGFSSETDEWSIVPPEERGAVLSAVEVEAGRGA